MTIEKMTSREGYHGVMMTDYNASGIPLFAIFVWGKEDGTDNYITVTDSDKTVKHEYKSFAEAMQNAIDIANGR